MTTRTRRSIRMPSIVSDIYDLYVSIRASKSNSMVILGWRVILMAWVSAIQARGPFDSRLIKSHVTHGLSSEHKRRRFN